MGTQQKKWWQNSWASIQVSIQLVSPASGDLTAIAVTLELEKVSIQLVSPASGDRNAVKVEYFKNPVSIQLVSPASGDSLLSEIQQKWKLTFPFN